MLCSNVGSDSCSDSDDLEEDECIFQPSEAAYRERDGESQGKRDGESECGRESRGSSECGPSGSDTSLSGDADEKNCGRGAIPLVKSCLQKAVRRMNPTLAGKCGRFLCQNSLTDLLRRLPIIIVEDSIVTPALPTIVWMMAADSKVPAALHPYQEIPPEIIAQGWKIPEACLDHLCRIAYSAAALPYRDFLCKGRDLPNVVKPAMQNHPFACEIVAMMVRASYGGTGGDVFMMTSMAELWFERGLNKLSQSTSFQSGMAEAEAQKWRIDMSPYMQVSPEIGRDTRVFNYLQEYVPAELSEQDVLLMPEAADFHCFPSMIDHAKGILLSVHHKLASSDSIRQSIWFHRSGVSHKNYFCNPDRPTMRQNRQGLSLKEIDNRRITEKIWQMIRPWADQWSLDMISKTFAEMKTIKRRISCEKVAFIPITESLKRMEEQT